jgi:predicted PurR-regulated permease PerM
VLLELRLITVPAFVALLFATALQPPVTALRRRGWRPLLATWTVLLAALVVVAGGISLLVPAFVDQTDELGERLEEGIAQIEDWLETGPLGIEDPDVRGAVDTAVDQTLESDPAALVDGVALAAEVLAGALLAMVMLFFFVKDGPRIVDWAADQIPAARRTQARQAGSAAWAALGAYVRGTLVVGLVNGTVIGVGLAFLGVPLALPLAIITALSAFFPLVGAVVAGTLAALVALVSGGVVDALIVVALTVVVQQIEGDVLSPLVMGRALKLHPLVILVALTVGAVTAGLLGAFLAVPLIGVVVAAAGAARQPSAVSTASAAGGDEGGPT